jgi:hypothetical protein
MRAFFSRLFGRGIGSPDGRVGVYIIGSRFTRNWHGPEAVGMDDAAKEAQGRGREDGDSGQHTPWAPARKPGYLRGLEARRAANIEYLHAHREAVVGQARAQADDWARRRDAAEAGATEAAAIAEAARGAEDATSEAESGFARAPGWVIAFVAIALMVADIFFTRVALVNALGYISDDEAWVIAVIIGALLFVGGVVKAYLEAVKARAEREGVQGPFAKVASSRLSNYVVWPVAIMIAGLAVGRWALIAAPSGFFSWAVAVGAFAALTMAAVLVAVVAYVGASAIFAARPRTQAVKARRRADRALEDAKKASLKASARADSELANAKALDEAFDRSIPMADEWWMVVIAAYWRGFAQARPEEQPDIDAINALTDGAPLALAQVAS